MKSVKHYIAADVFAVKGNSDYNLFMITRLYGCEILVLWLSHHSILQ